MKVLIFCSVIFLALSCRSNSASSEQENKEVSGADLRLEKVEEIRADITKGLSDFSVYNNENSIEQDTNLTGQVLRGDCIGFLEKYPNTPEAEIVKRIYDSVPYYTLMKLSILKNLKAEKISAINSKVTSLKDYRVGYTKDLRTKFLDQSLDIKCDINGKQNEELVLTYSLFNDVWTRKFETEGFYSKFFKQGFSKVTLKDGYGYTKTYSPSVLVDDL